MKHLRAGTRQLHDLLVGDVAELARIGHDARVGGHDSFYVLKDLAAVGFERNGESERSDVRGAAPHDRDVHLLGPALEAGDDGDDARFQLTLDAFGVYLQDLGFGVEGAGLDTGLEAGEGDRFMAEGLKRHGGEGAGDYLAGGPE